MPLKNKCNNFTGHNYIDLRRLIASQENEGKKLSLWFVLNKKATLADEDIRELESLGKWKITPK